MKKALLLVLLLLLSGCTQPKKPKIIKDGKELPIALEVADTPEERVRGLMGRTELPEGKGMLFVFDSEAVQSFWMKNTVVDLEVIFIAKNGTVVAIRHMEPCISDPCPSYSSEKPALYAVETKPGFSASNNIEPGTVLDVIIS
ncbi:MAG: DUF192 domain-containing protein [Candidatus Anstonellales archaeon]